MWKVHNFIWFHQWHVMPVEVKVEITLLIYLLDKKRYNKVPVWYPYPEDTSLWSQISSVLSLRRTAIVVRPTIEWRKSNERVNLIDMHGYFRPRGCYDACSYNDWISPPGSALHGTPEVLPEDHQDITGTHYRPWLPAQIRAPRNFGQIASAKTTSIGPTGQMFLPTIRRPTATDIQVSVT